MIFEYGVIIDTKNNNTISDIEKSINNILEQSCSPQRICVLVQSPKNVPPIKWISEKIIQLKEKGVQLFSVIDIFKEDKEEFKQKDKLYLICRDFFSKKIPISISLPEGKSNGKIGINYFLYINTSHYLKSKKTIENIKNSLEKKRALLYYFDKNTQSKKVYSKIKSIKDDDVLFFHKAGLYFYCLNKEDDIIDTYRKINKIRRKENKNSTDIVFKKAKNSINFTKKD
jgi:mannose/fructose/N-acetylgalactosamine-specific phosphotransferase system component IIB